MLAERVKNSAAMVKALLESACLQPPAYEGAGGSASTGGGGKTRSFVLKNGLYITFFVLMFGGYGLRVWGGAAILVMAFFPCFIIFVMFPLMVPSLVLILDLIGYIGEDDLTKVHAICLLRTILCYAYSAVSFFHLLLPSTLSRLFCVAAARAD